MQVGGFRGFREQPYWGANVSSEFYWTRLQYTSSYASGNSFGYRRFYGGWSRDYPKADNDCLIALRRLTHINSPSPLNVVDLNSDQVFNYPWIYAVQVNTWTFTEQEVVDRLVRGFGLEAPWALALRRGFARSWG